MVELLNLVFPKPPLPPLAATNSSPTFMKSYINVFLDGSYKISDNLDFNFNLNNILNRYNERFFMYPELGYNLLTGIRWIF